MIHNYLKNDSEDGSHYAVGLTDSYILIQLQNSHGEQVRVQLSIEQAEHLMNLIEVNINKLK